MKKTNLLKSILLLCALVAGSGSVWADPTVLFHETFGDNSGSARAWSDSYSVKSGIAAVYANVKGYTITNAKQSKNTTGSTKSALFQTTKGSDASIIIGPLNARYESLKVTYKWKAASIGQTYFTSLAYKTSSDGDFATVKSYGNTDGATSAGATSYIDVDYDLPTTASSSTLYLKIVFNTSNTGAFIDEVELQSLGAKLPDEAAAPTTTWDFTSDGIGTVTNNSTCTLTATDGVTTATYVAGGSDNNSSGYLKPGGKSTMTGASATRYFRFSIEKSGSLSLTSNSGKPGKYLIYQGATSDITEATEQTSITTSAGSLTASQTYDIANGEYLFIGFNAQIYTEKIVWSIPNELELFTSANMAGWRAFYDGSQAYTADANTSVYVADSDPEGSTITLKNIGKGVPSGVPVILKTSAGDHKIVLTKGGSATYSGTNNLAVTDGTNDVSSKYRLGYNSTDGVGFYPYSATKPAAGIVYLNIDASAHALSIDFEEGDVTGIAEVSAKKEFKGEYFNLAGQRVDANHKGIVIVNGKKFFNK